MSQEILQAAMRMRQESEQVEQQLQFVVQQMSELENFRKNLDSMSENKESEFFANVGRGVYVKAQREKDEKLFVEVGAGIVLKKSYSEAKKVIDGQIKKFQQARMQLSQQLEGYAAEFQRMLSEVEAMKK